MRLLLVAICREQLSVGSSRPRWLTAHMGRRLRAPAGWLWICLQPRHRADCGDTRPPMSIPTTTRRTHTQDTWITVLGLVVRVLLPPKLGALSWHLPRRSATPGDARGWCPRYGSGYRLCRSALPCAATHGGGVPRFSRTSSARVFTATDDRTRSSLLATHHRQSRELGAWEGTAGTPVDIFVW